jgi:isopenicillin N synthase-like dioxygenase
MNPASVPVVDLAPFLAGSPEGKRAVAQAVGRACEDIGFLTIVGHGLGPDLIQHASEAARRFFDLPVEEKLKLKLLPSGVGYSPVAGENLAASLGQAAPADLKESLNIGAQMEQNLWPESPGELKPAFTEYFRAMAALAANLMRLFALALDLPEDYFADKIDRHASFLRVINYPPPTSEPLPGQLRAGAHSDYGSLTLLRSENAPGGLQVQTRGGEWIDVVAAPDSFVVNLGDLMMRWTNDRWVSTLHRVVNPPPGEWQRSRRQSLVFFHNPNPDTLITCLPGCCGPDHPAKYPPISAGEFLWMKANKAYGAKSEGGA